MSPLREQRVRFWSWSKTLLLALFLVTATLAIGVALLSTSRRADAPPAAVAAAPGMSPSAPNASSIGIMRSPPTSYSAIERSGPADPEMQRAGPPDPQMQRTSAAAAASAANAAAELAASSN